MGLTPKRLLLWIAMFWVGCNFVALLALIFTDFDLNESSWQATVILVMQLLVGWKLAKDVDRRVYS